MHRDAPPRPLSVRPPPSVPMTEPAPAPAHDSEAEHSEAERARAYLAAIVESSDEAIIGKSLSGVIQSWNEGAVRMFGYAPEEAIGQPITLIIPAELRAQEEQLFERVLRGEHIAHFDTVRLAKDGRRVPISLAVSAILDTSGEVIGASKIARNVSERQQAERALRASEQRLWNEAYALERMNEWSTRVWRSQGLGDGLQLILDAVIELLNADKGAAQLLDEVGRLRIAAQRGFDAASLHYLRQLSTGDGPTAGQAPGQHERIIIDDIDGEIVDVDSARGFAAQRELARRAGCRALLWTPLIGFDGTLLGALSLQFQAAHRPSEAELRRLDLFLLQACDFIQRCGMEQELRAREDALRDADRQKDEFLALLAHELRNPLAPICNAAEVLARRLAASPEAQAGVAVIRRQAAQLTRLVDDLLDVARVTQGRIELKRATVEVASAVAQGLESVESLLQEKRQQIGVTASAEPLYVRADFARLVQCMGNLLTNAIKYTDPGGRIRLEIRAEGKSAVIEVSDSGVGIAPEQLARIFQLFVQGERTLDRAQGGLGIGLPVVKKLMEMHGGSVSARSAGIGRGATFELRLPLVSAPVTSESASQSSDSAPKRIFIVDDNPDGAHSLALLLQLEGHEAQAVLSSREALERIEAFRPDVALLDIGLPGMNGYELLQRLRELPTLQPTTFVAVTGYGQPGDRERIRAAGFRAHLIKPVNMAELLGILSASLSARASAGTDP